MTQPSAVAIVAAWNEAPRVAHVVAPLLASGAFARVLVVDDGSTDDTAGVARATGAEVLRLPVNGGKGAAMRAGVAATREPVVAFFDADLVGLMPEHVTELVEPVTSGRAGMSVGLMDYGPYNVVQTAMPLISGQRAVRRDLLARVPPSMWQGFRIEAGLNEAAHVANVPVEVVVLRGVSQVPKWHKVGVRRGISDGVKMLIDVLRATRDAKETVR